MTLFGKLKELGIYRYRGKRAGRYRSLHAVLPSVLLCNVRAIANKIDELECVCNLNSADVVCVTETWLTDTIPDSAVSMKKYVLFRRDRPIYAGGIAAYINCAIPCRIVSTPMLVDSPTEILWIKLHPRRLPRPVSIILLGIIYHPPHATAEENNVLYQHVREAFVSFTLNHPDCLVYLTGDFNPASTNVSSEIFKRSCGLTQTVKVLTHETGILDWFWLTQQNGSMTPNNSLKSEPATTLGSLSSRSSRGLKQQIVRSSEDIKGTVASRRLVNG